MRSEPFWMKLGEAKTRLIRLVYKRDPVNKDFRGSEEDMKLFDAAADYIEELMEKIRTLEEDSGG